MPETVFLTGGTGYLGSYVLSLLPPDTRVVALVRAKGRDHAVDKLWRAMQLHDVDFPELLSRVRFAYGDLHAPGLGLDADDRKAVLACDSVLHIAASLNRMSNKACVNSNLRGTLSVVRLAQHMNLRRFSDVSTVAIAGRRTHQVVPEDLGVDWALSDFDPYARTKKFAEHMVRELLPDVPLTVFRPSIVMGDERHPHTTQFDMVLATSVLAQMRVLPLAPHLRFDIVPASWVGQCIAHIHMNPAEHDTYNLSAGHGSCTTQQLIGAFGLPTVYAPRLGPTFFRGVRALARLPRGNPVQFGATLFKVFWPYLVWDVVFDNQRAVDAVGRAPAPFSDYGPALVRWARDVKFTYPYEPLPDDVRAKIVEAA